MGRYFEVVNGRLLVRVGIACYHHVVAFFLTCSGLRSVVFIKHCFRYVFGREGLKLEQHAPLTQYAAVIRTSLSRKRLTFVLIALLSVSAVMSVRPPAYSVVSMRITLAARGPSSFVLLGTDSVGRS